MEEKGKLLEQVQIQGLLFQSRSNKYYVAGLNSSAGIVLMTKTKEYVIVDGRYQGQMEEIHGKDSLCLMTPEKSLWDWVEELTQRHQIQTLGFEGDTVSFDVYQTMTQKISAQLVSVDLRTFRGVKTPKEQGYIQKACAIGDLAYEHLLTKVQVGMREKDLSRMILDLIREYGGEKESFDPVVVSGARGAYPHGKPSEKIIEKGDLVTLDFGVQYETYASDMTRTFSMGSPSPFLESVYQGVKEANEKVLAQIRPGVACAHLDQVARQVLETYGYDGYFTHNLGHGVGLLVHEFPTLSPKSKDILQEGMVLTVEPGVYIPKVGGVRVEDTLVVTKDGCTVWTKSEKELVKIK